LLPDDETGAIDTTVTTTRRSISFQKRPNGKPTVTIREYQNGKRQLIASISEHYPNRQKNPNYATYAEAIGRYHQRQSERLSKRNNATDGGEPTP
jgi:hypothetical protein